MRDFNYGNSYFSKNIGFVIEGHRFRYKEDAIQYLIDTNCMDMAEAISYLDRMVTGFEHRAARTGAVSVGRAGV